MTQDNKKGVDIIAKYFPSLSDRQKAQFEAFDALYRDWNSKINVISRKDIDNLYERHILHSLAIACFWGELKTGTRVLDMGTGGGFPGIPLAVLYPEVKFHLIDRIGKKIKVCNEVSRSLGLDNITTQHGDIGECHDKYDYIVSRAVMSLDALVALIRKNISPKNVNTWPNGLVCLKGASLDDEISRVKLPVSEFGLNEYFNEDFFNSKALVYVKV
ncbi:MAG: 16S rRNA (guanine(527)-N(7))-methyltransferase RsmG [Muribaculaceae bacterium]|nr:16S rRNA (guanine(527)-N(7))-methyltransferase RsmG [Muribaculaceae bacterium]